MSSEQAIVQQIPDTIQPFDREAIIREAHLRVTEPKRIEFNPAEYDLERLTEYGVDKSKLREFLELVVEFVNMPIIQDDFGSDHLRRHAWREDIGRRFGFEGTKFVSMNKLKANKLNIFSGRIEILESTISNKSKKPSPIIGFLQKKVVHIRMIYGWGVYSEEFKVACAKEAELVGREILAEFKKNPAIN